MRRQADPDTGLLQPLEITQVRRWALLAKAVEATASVRHVEEYELDSRLTRGVGDRVTCLEAEVVELADGRITGRALLTVDGTVEGANGAEGLATGLRDHRVSPGPEVGACPTPAERALEAVRVGVHETRQRQLLAHLGILAAPERPGVARGAPTILEVMVARAVSTPLAQLPNALTIFRFGLVPVFIVLLASGSDGQSWPAAVVFAAAAVTDQLDGWLARRLRVESEFGKYADPLADRLMIDVAVIMLFVYGRLPWPAIVIIVGRDVLLVLGARLAMPRGYEFSVSFLGKLATWVIYFAITFVIATPADTDWPIVIFWIGAGLAVTAGAAYAAAVWGALWRGRRANA
jgi:CDP-diacylglycerol--glycerol-3-phosphate 3-phosphatidyltransferase